jgi:hypothetical protein
MIAGAIRYGMNAAARDSALNIEPPEHWTSYYDPEHISAVTNKIHGPEI